MRQQSTAERLKIIMQEKNLKQVDVIEKSKPFQEQLGIKLGKSALSQYVNGVQSPDQHKLTLLSLTLDVSEAWLMGYDVPREREIKNSQQPTPTIDFKEMAAESMSYDGMPLNDEDIDLIASILETRMKNRDKE
ncbi:TPA: helix-turn-helix domain-containing protein [Streptococcus suis]